MEIPLKKIQGLKFKVENPWNKCRCCHWKKFKGENSRVKIASYLVYQRPNVESLFINHENQRKFRGDPLKKYRGLIPGRNRYLKKKKMWIFIFQPWKKNSGVIQDLYQIWPLKKIFRGLNSRMKRNILSLPCWNSRVKGTLGFSSTLQELKLQGIKICDGVVFSRYSRAQCFAIHLSDFGKLPKCLCSSVGRALDL